MKKYPPEARWGGTPYPSEDRRDVIDGDCIARIRTHM